MCSPAKGTCISCKRPRVPAKGTCISAKGPCVPAIRERAFPLRDHAFSLRVHVFKLRRDHAFSLRVHVFKLRRDRELWRSLSYFEYSLYPIYIHIHIHDACLNFSLRSKMKNENLVFTWSSLKFKLNLFPSKGADNSF